MTNQQELLSLAEEIRKGLFLMGPNRAVAMSTHATRDLLLELEEKSENLVERIKQLDQ